jgi:TonB family protein
MKHSGYFPTAILALSLAGTGVAMAGQASPARVDRTKGAVSIIYPVHAQLKGEQGKVVMQLQLDDMGKPTGKIVLLTSSGYDDLDTAAVQSAMRWPYSPAFQPDGASTESWVTVDVNYKLPKEPGTAKQ